MRENHSPSQKWDFVSGPRVRRGRKGEGCIDGKREQKLKERKKLGRGLDGEREG